MSSIITSYYQHKHNCALLNHSSYGYIIQDTKLYTTARIPIIKEEKEERERERRKR